ncbi:MAG: GAF domain-containing protein [Chloroflexi bacterium]|nr:GAF domain-containing protein [Chloroflexota bacterium]
MLDLTMERAAELVSARAGSLLLVDDSTGELVFEAGLGPGASDLRGSRFLAGSGLVGEVLQSTSPVVLRAADLSEPHDRRRDQGPMISIIGVPLISRGQAIGLIELLHRRDGRPFDQTDEWLMATFASHAASAIDNARLFTRTDQALEARIEELSIMQQIDRELNASLAYDQILGLTLDWALSVTKAQVGFAAGVVGDDVNREILQVLANRGIPDDILRSYGDGQPWPSSQGVIAEVMHSGQPLIAGLTTETGQRVQLAEGMASHLLVPILRESQAIGAIGLQDDLHDSFGDTERVFMNRLADHAAIALENARLFERLRRANDAKTEFVSFVCHEITQPVTAITGYTDLLLDGAAGDLSPEQHECLHKIRLNEERVKTMLSDLMDVSVIESGRIRLCLEDVDLAGVIHEVLRAMEGQLACKFRSVDTDIADGLPSVRGDRSRLIQIVANLISNAHKYTPERGHITVCAQSRRSSPEHGRTQDCALCSVMDTGIGIAQDDQARLFTKCFRSDHPVVQNTPGTGLGLAITKSLVELHGGRIWLASEPGTGSTFYFTIPASSACAQPGAAAAAVSCPDLGGTG